MIDWAQGCKLLLSSQQQHVAQSIGILRELEQRQQGKIDTSTDWNGTGLFYLFGATADHVLYGSGNSADIETYLMSLLSATTRGRLTFLGAVAGGR